MESFNLYDMNTVSRETGDDTMSGRYYGLRPIEGLFMYDGRHLRSLGFSLVPNSSTRSHDGVWKRADDKTHIVCYVTPPTDRRKGFLSLRYVDFKLKAVEIPLTQETAKLLLAGFSNSALMASEEDK